MSVSDVMPIDAPGSTGDFETSASFRIALRGFDRDEVREAFERMSARYRALSKKNASLQAQVAKLESKMAAYQLEEQTFRNAVLMLQKQYDEARQRSLDEITQAAERARADALREARAEADKLLSAAQERARKVEEYVRRLETHQTQFNDVVTQAITRLQDLRPDTVDAASTLQPNAAAGTGPAVQHAMPEPPRAPAPAAAPQLAGRITSVLASSGAIRPNGDGTSLDALVTMEQIEAMLKGIDAAIVEIPALGAE